MQSLYHVITCFEGVEKLEAKERWKLPESDVLPGAPLPDVYAAEDAEHRPGHCGESQWTAPRSVKIPKWNKRFAWLSDF